MQSYFLRIGSLGEVHLARGSKGIGRNCRVVARTPSGLQLGLVLGTSRQSGGADLDSVRILRITTDADELLIRRLSRHKRQAVQECRDALNQAGSKSILLDIDQMLDGGTLKMHFLGEVDPIAEKITTRVADAYEAVVRTRHFAKLLRDGCGPDCGTGEGCASGACSSCSAAVACKANAS